MKRLRHNLLRERITTLIGLLIFLTVLGSVFVVPGITWSDAWWPLVVSLVLMLMPDRALGIVRRTAERKAQEVTNLVPVLLLGVLLAGCVSPREAELLAQLEAHRAELVTVDSSAPRPAYLTPPPAGSTKRQRKHWQRKQAQGMVEASRAVPAKVKARKGTVALATAPGAQASVTAPTTVKASGSATVATGPSSAATNNAGLGQDAGGGVNTGPAGAATGPTVPPTPWYRHLLNIIGVLLLLAGLVYGLVYLYRRNNPRISF